MAFGMSHQVLEDVLRILVYGFFGNKLLLYRLFLD